jgi:hypothetical protein
VTYPARLADSSVRAHDPHTDCAFTLPLGAVVDEVTAVYSTEEGGELLYLRVIADGAAVHVHAFSSRSSFEELLVSDADWPAALADWQACSEVAA